MFFSWMSRLPGWAIYHGYQNLDEEDPNQNMSDDVEAGELKRLQPK